MKSFNFGLYNDCYLYLSSKEDYSAEYILSLESLIINLSVCRKRFKRKLGMRALDIFQLSTEHNGLVHPLQTHPSSICVSSTTSLKIFKRSKCVYLVVYESWETVKYLQISNSSGYAIVVGGALFFPNVDQDSVRIPELLLTSLAHNSLWTDGKQVLNNTGTWSSVKENDNGEDTPCVDLAFECNSDVASRVENSIWRQKIEESLKRSMIDIQEIQTAELCFQRREFLMKKSVSVLNKLSDECR